MTVGFSHLCYCYRLFPNVKWLRNMAASVVLYFFRSGSETVNSCHMTTVFTYFITTKCSSRTIHVNSLVFLYLCITSSSVSKRLNISNKQYNVIRTLCFLVPEIFMNFQCDHHNGTPDSGWVGKIENF